MVSDGSHGSLSRVWGLERLVRVSLVHPNRSLQWLKMGQVRLMHAEHVKQWLQREHLSQFIPLSEYKFLINLNSIKYSSKKFSREWFKTGLPNSAYFDQCPDGKIIYVDNFQLDLLVLIF